jgi:RNA polymerase sigma factor (TIGR02999 family)
MAERQYGGDLENKRSLDEIVERQYLRLRELAAKIRWRNRQGSTTATSLLNEAYIRLSRNPPDLRGRDHGEILAIFANAMRQILIDQARGKRAGKRGGGNRPVSLDKDIDVLRDPAALSPEDLLNLEAAVKELERVDAQKAKIIDFRFFLGMTADESALVLGLSKSTVEREGRQAKAFLISKLAHKQTTELTSDAATRQPE